MHPRLLGNQPCSDTACSDTPEHRNFTPRKKEAPVPIRHAPCFMCRSAKGKKEEKKRDENGATRKVLSRYGSHKHKRVAPELRLRGPLTNLRPQHQRCDLNINTCHCWRGSKRTFSICPSIRLAAAEISSLCPAPLIVEFRLVLPCRRETLL